MWYIYNNQRLWVISFIEWNVFSIRLLYFPQVTIFDLFLPINSEQFTSERDWLQNFFTRFIKSCGLQILRSCRLAVADFKNYEVADLRLRIQESRKVVADLRLRTKLLNVQLRTCGCGWRKLKFGCGFADCGLKKKLAVPSTAEKYTFFTYVAMLRIIWTFRLGLSPLHFSCPFVSQWRHFRKNSLKFLVLLTLTLFIFTSFLVGPEFSNLDHSTSGT